LHRPDRTGLASTDHPHPSPSHEPHRAKAPFPTPTIAWDDSPVASKSPVVATPSQAVTVARVHRGDSARVKAGETLVDFAARIYGSKVDLAELWKLNRDQLATQDSPLRPGMMLRTPEL